MSAFICSKDLFVALACFAATGRNGSFNVDPRYLKHPSNKAALALIGEYTPEGLATHYAQWLYEANARSVDHRYNETNDREKIVIRDIAEGTDVPALVILKACNCLDYQSCEPDDWEQSPAYEILRRIKDAAIHALPGYDNADGWNLKLPESRPVLVNLSVMARRSARANRPTTKGAP